MKSVKSWFVGGWALVVVVAGCSSSSAPSGPCAARHGVYRVHWTQISGNCGAIPDSNVDLDATSAAASSCSTPNTRLSADNCHVESSFKCNETTGTSEAALAVTWSQEGHSGAGSATFTMYDVSRNITCKSTYDLNYTKL